MLPSLHRISGFLFSLIAGSFFVAYLLLRNELMAPWPQWWMRIADTPLLLVGILYGGASLSLSISKKEKTSRFLFFFVMIPLLALFFFLLALNYWDVLGLPKGAA
ncbi:MAG: hypothetical protein PHI23_01310 [Candidatus Peribacteraceae bacterium]|nr:hypothetical protein [Candidatus Peribacteraceae bacterium]